MGPMTRLSRRAFVGGLVNLGTSAIGLALASGCGLLPATQTQHSSSARVGVLSVASRADSDSQLQVFIERARELGWLNGQNFVIEDRWGNGQRDAVIGLAAELVRLPVDVIIAFGTAPVQAAKQASTTIPIVMLGVASDPVGLGLIASLARPGGNVTGMTGLVPMVSTKRLELLAGLVPGLSRVAVLVTPDNPSKPQNVRELQVAADNLNIQLLIEDVALTNLPGVFEAAAAWHAQAILLIGDAVLNSAMTPLVAQATQLGVPAIYSERPWVAAGGLMYYGPDPLAQWVRAADYMDRILRGARVADLPVEQPTTFQFAVNAKAVQARGLTIPPDMVAQVTEWVE
jgi:ABC-type uncharacterized transport system substrate-binding protein